MLNLQRYNCDSCGAEFEAACLSELQRKKAEHVCAKLPNRRVQRAAQIQQARVDEFVFDTAVNRIEDSNRQKLVQQGMLVNA